MKPGHPDKLYAYLEGDGAIALSPTKPSGQWAEYERGPSDVLAEYYELSAYSEIDDLICPAAPTWFHTERNISGNYVIL
jgi:hypothetical protein